MHKKRNKFCRALAFMLAATITLTTFPEAAITAQATEDSIEESSVNGEEQVENEMPEEGTSEAAEDNEAGNGQEEENAGESAKEEEATGAVTEETLPEVSGETESEETSKVEKDTEVVPYGIVEPEFQGQGEFQDVQLDFYQDTVRIVNGFFSCGYNTTVSIRVREYDEKEQLLNVQEMINSEALSYSSMQGGYELSRVQSSGDADDLCTVSLLEDTKKIKLVACVNYNTDWLDAYTVESDYVERDDYPSVTVTVDEENSVIDRTSAIIDFKYQVSAKLVNNYRYSTYPSRKFELIYGTDENLQDATRIELTSRSETDVYAQLSGLTANTKYYCQLSAGYELNTCTENGKDITRNDLQMGNICSGTSEVYSFTTLAENSVEENYNLMECFPDDGIRAAVIKSLGKSVGTTEVTKTELTSITELQAANAEVSDITGIELLINLRTLDLSGNKLTTFPNLSQNIYLNQVKLNQNYIPDNEFVDGTIESRTAKNAIWVTNDWVSNTRKSQIHEGEQIAVTYEPTYYGKSGKYPFFIVLDTDTTSGSYQVEIDGTSYSLKPGNEPGAEINCWQSGFLQATLPFNDTGNFTKTVKITDSEKEIAEFEVEFSDVKYNGNEKESASKLLTSGYWRMEDGNSVYCDIRVEADVPEEENRIFDHAELCDSNGDVFAESVGLEKLNNVAGAAHSYKNISGVTVTWDTVNIVRYNVYFRANNFYGNGSYDMKVYYRDGNNNVLSETDTIKNAITFSDDVSVNYANISSGKDSSGEYLYIEVQGTNLQKDNMQFEISYKGMILKTEKISCLPKYADTVIVKLKKVDWNVSSDETMVLGISDLKGNKLYETDFRANKSHIYYAQYNDAKERFEVGLSGEELALASKLTLVTVREGTDVSIENTTVKKTVRDAKVQDGWLYVSVPKKEMKSSSYYYVVIRNNGKDYASDSIYYYSNTQTSGGKGSYCAFANDNLLVKKGCTLINVVLYSSCNNESAKIPTKVEVLSESGECVLSTTSINKTYSSKNGTYQSFNFRASMNPKNLPAGVYTLVAKDKEGKEIARSFSDGLRILEAGEDRFIVQSVPYECSWNNIKELYIPIAVANVSSSDEIEVSVKTLDGSLLTPNKVSKAISTNGSGYVYCYLPYDANNPYKSCYITLQDKSKKDVKAYSVSGEEYFTDKGAEVKVRLYDGNYGINSKREVCSIQLATLTNYPVKLYLYDSENLEIYNTIEFTEDDVDARGVYSFTADDLKTSSGKKITNCAISAIDSANRMIGILYENTKVGVRDATSTGTTNSISLGLLTDAGIEGADEIDLQLTGDDSLASKTVVSKVYTNGKTVAPKLTIADTSVATLTVDAKDKTKAVVRAIGVGTTVIKATYGDVSIEVPVVVTKDLAINGIELNREEIALTYDSGSTSTEHNQMDETKHSDLWVKLNPADAFYDDVELSYTTTGIAQVTRIQEGEEELNDTFCVTASGTGTGTITFTATVTKGESVLTYTTEATVSATRQLTEAEKQSIVNSVDVSKLQAVLLKGDKNAGSAVLSDVEIPYSGNTTVKGTWSWNEPKTALKADDNVPVKSYYATFTPEDNNIDTFTASFPVRVTMVTGISIEKMGNQLVSGGDKIRFKVNINKIGAEITPNADEAVSLQVNATGKKQVSVSENSTGSIDVNQKVSANQQGVYEVSTKGQYGDVTVTASMEVTGIKAWKKDIACKYTLISGISNIVFNPIYDADKVQDEKALVQFLPEFSSESGIASGIIEYSSLRGENAPDRMYFGFYYREGSQSGLIEKNLNKKFNFATSNKNIAEVKQNKQGYSYVQLKGAGIVTITVTAKDKGKSTSVLTLNIRDYTPALAGNKLTISTYMEKSSVEIPTVEMNGAKVTSVQVKDEDKLVVESNAGKYYLNLLNKENYTKKQTIKTTLTLTATQDEKNYTASYPITVTVDIAKPKATVKNTQKANLFYTDAEAVYSLSTTARIESVEQLNTECGYDTVVNGNTLIFKAKSLTTETLKNYSNKKALENQANIRVHFKGYTEEADQLLKITVATTNTVPALKAADLNIIDGQSRLEVRPYDSRSGQFIDVSTATIRDNAGARLSIVDGKLYAEPTTGKVSARLLFANATQPVSISFKIGKMTKPELNVGAKSVKINVSENIAKSGFFEVPLTIKNSDIVPTNDSVTLTGNANAAKLISSGYLSYYYEEGSLHLGLNGTKPDDIKASSYVFNVNCSDSYGNKQVKSGKLTVAIVGGAITAKVKTAGKINLLDRSMTCMSVTATLNNTTANVVSAEVVGAQADKFYVGEAGVFDKYAVTANKFNIYAEENADLVSNTKYAVTVRLGLNTGAYVDSVITVTPVQTLPALKVTATNAVLYRNGTASTTVVASSNIVDLYEGNLCMISNTNSQNFTFDSNTNTLSLKDSADVKPGKYKITFYYDIEGAAVNTKMPTVVLQVEVK